MCIYVLQKAAAKKVDWRRKHDEFIHSIRAAREVDEAIKTGKFCTLISCIPKKSFKNFP